MSINYKFFGGFSSSDSLWKDGSYIYSENINTFNHEYIQISPEFENIVLKEKIDYLIPNLYDEDDFCYVVWDSIFKSSWELVYKNSYAWVSENINFAFRTSRNDFIIHSKFVNNEKTAFESSEGYFPIYNWEVYNSKITWYINKYSKYFSYIWANNRLYLANLWSYKIISFDNSETLESPSFSWIHIKNHSNWFQIFSRSWKMTFWTWVNKVGFSDTYELNLDLLYVSSFSWVNYLFSEEGLFFQNGIIASPIAYKTKSNYLDFEKFDFQKDIRYGNIVNKKYSYTICNTKKWVDLCVLWAENVWSPINFSSVYSKTREKVISMIKYKKWVLVHYKEKNAEKFGIDYFSFENNLSTEKWFIITKEYKSDSLINLKKVSRLQFFCDKLKSWEYLKIYFSINNWDFEEIRILTENDNWKNGFYEILNFNKEFHKIVFKLEIKWAFKLYDFLLYDNKIK